MSSGKIDRFHGKGPLIAPSLLMCDFGNLEREVQQLEAAQVEILHLDVMDGHFVPNFTYGLPIVQAFRKLSNCFLDVHLMIAEPERFIDQFADCGADLLTVHVEATSNPRKALQQIRSKGTAAGIALNPDTPLSDIQECLDLCDLILVMSVLPGFGGQAFHPAALEKLQALKDSLDDRILLEVDGGINERTISDCVRAGADVLVVGSAIFNHKDYPARVRELTRLAASTGAVTD